jgi:hypothetical protein
MTIAPNGSAPGDSLRGLRVRSRSPLSSCFVDQPNRRVDRKIKMTK